MFDKAKELYELQKKARELQRRLREKKIEIEKMDGKIIIVMNGEQKIEDLKIDEGVLSPENAFEIEKNIKEAIAQGITQSQQAAAAEMKEMGGLGLPGM